MFRISRTILIAALVLFLAPAMACAQWPAVQDAVRDTRGPGFYYPIYKLLLIVILLFIWVQTADWLGRDAALHGEKTKLKPEVWNPIFVFTFFFVFMILVLGIPIFIVGYLLMVLAYVVPLGIYVGMRNSKVAPDDRVFTPKHIKKVISQIGKKKKGPEVKRLPYEYGAPVEFAPQTGDKSLDQACLIGARSEPNFYICTKELFADALNNRAEKMLLDYTAEGVAVKYTVDGMWHNAAPQVHEKDPLNRELGDSILTVIKRLCNLKPEDRRSRQEGKMQVGFQGAKTNTVVTTQGTPTGERVLINFLPIIKTPPTLEELGMREQHRNKLKELIAEKQNLVVFCSMPGDGLSATWVAMLKFADRFTRDYVGIEDSAKREPDVENVEIAKYNSAAGETALSLLPKIALKQPEVFVISDIVDADVFNFLIKQIDEEERKGIVSTRAKEGVEAILRLLMLKPDVPKFAKHLGGIVNQRLIRKLCDQCKEAFQPPPEALQRLGIPPGRVTVLYRERQPPPPDAPKPKKGDPPLICPKCRGIGYYGRTAIYEIVVVDDKLRQAIIQQPKIETLRQVSKQAGNWSLQEEGILLLAQGVTSLQELQRVLKA